MNLFPTVRMQRLRKPPRLRNMLGVSFPGPERFLWPVFITEGRNGETPIDSMPGQFRFTPDRLLLRIPALLDQGVGGLLLFGVVDAARKDPLGASAAHDRGPVQQAIRALRKQFPDLLIFTDVCLCGYTDHGHCAPLDRKGGIRNDAAIAQLGRVALSHARAGADGVAPSAMMDGQVAAIRRALDAHAFSDTLIMSYSTKFASAFYGPFRDAAGSAPRQGDRRSYQAPSRDLRQALRESALDEAEGADILMVKPALLYLDVLAKLRERTDLPIAAYNVSGEYAMLHASADRGWGDLKAMARESITALTRAGADILISYWANRYREIVT